MTVTVKFIQTLVRNGTDGRPLPAPAKEVKTKFEEPMYIYFEDGHRTRLTLTVTALGIEEPRVQDQTQTAVEETQFVSWDVWLKAPKDFTDGSTMIGVSITQEIEGATVPFGAEQIPLVNQEIIVEAAPGKSFGDTLTGTAGYSAGAVLITVISGVILEIVKGGPITGRLKRLIGKGSSQPRAGS